MILGILIGAGLAYLICYFLPKEKVRKTNEQLLKQEEEKIKELKDKQGALNLQITNLESQKESLKTSLSDLKEQAKESANIFLEEEMNLAQEKLDRALEEASRKYQKDEEAYKQNYLKVMEESAEEYTTIFAKRNSEYQQLEQQLDKLRAAVKATVAANLREEEKKNKVSFYKLDIPLLNIQEVEKIRTIIPYLQNPRPLNKAIWESYYRNSATDLVNRIVGPTTKIGIYRITNLLDNKIYIGQSVNIGERFKTHIKCGLGIDTPQNKLYAAMIKDGVENFSFEIVEECNPSLLNEKEKYWIEYYQSNIYGYNMSIGGAKGNKDGI
jgi:hypothetical protein